MVFAEKKCANRWKAEQLRERPGTVSAWCADTMRPNLETLVKIAKCLDVDVKNWLWSIKK
ncbi:MAG: helix-turn-helix transcriptional regulator [Prevotellaceae bacterium]|nr:helix-turn-helix transcriptional regulator [Prevotellaceae bacterium]